MNLQALNIACREKAYWEQTSKQFRAHVRRSMRLFGCEVRIDANLVDLPYGELGLFSRGRAVANLF